MVLIGSMKVASSKLTLSGRGDDAALGDPGHGFDVFTEAAAVGSEAGGEAGGLVLLALGEEAIFAVEAGATRRVVEAHHAIAGLEFCDARADGDDGAGQFVAEDLGRLDVALEDFLDVGAADAAGGDFDENFAGADFGDGDFFDDGRCPFRGRRRRAWFWGWDQRRDASSWL